MAKKSQVPKHPPQAKELPAALQSLNAKKLQLADLRLLTSATSLNPAVSPQALPKEVNQEISVHCARSPEEASLIYMLDFSLKSLTENGDPALAIGVRFGLIYRFENLDGIGEHEAQIFGQTTALFCIWPYWREFVQNMVGRMGLPPIRIPPMRPSDLQFSVKPQPEKQPASTGKKRRK